MLLVLSGMKKKPSRYFNKDNKKVTSSQNGMFYAYIYLFSLFQMLIRDHGNLQRVLKITWHATTLFLKPELLWS